MAAGSLCRLREASKHLGGLLGGAATLGLREHQPPCWGPSQEERCRIDYALPTYFGVLTVAMSSCEVPVH